MRSAVIWETMREYLTTEVVGFSRTEKMYEAKRYILRQWEGLTRYLQSGYVPIDNNDCERLIKQVALGRKNWLFLGSVGSGHRTATLMTIVSSAVRNDLDVAAYLTDILERRVAGDTDYQSMLAHEWAKSQPNHLRAHRQKERADKNRRRDRQRLARRLERLQNQSRSSG
ncbi:MAG: transposase, partial [Planctomycetota bacterium]